MVLPTLPPNAPNPWTPNKIMFFPKTKSVRNISIYNLEISSSSCGGTSTDLHKRTHKTVEPVAFLEPCTSRFQKFSDPKSLGFGSASASIGPSFRGFGMPGSERAGAGIRFMGQFSRNDSAKDPPKILRLSKMHKIRGQSKVKVVHIGSVGDCRANDFETFSSNRSTFPTA